MFLIFSMILFYDLSCKYIVNKQSHFKDLSDILIY